MSSIILSLVNTVEPITAYGKTARGIALRLPYIPVLLFLGVFAFSGLSPTSTSTDSRWTVYIAMSMARHHVTNLDDYEATIEQNDYYATECVDSQGRIRNGPPSHCDGHWYSRYPIGGPLLTAPLIVTAVEMLRLARPLLKHVHSWDPITIAFLRGDFDPAHALIEKWVASFLLALATVTMYFIACRFLPARRAVFLALLFGLATSAYSVAGRALWQHTPSMLLLSVIIYLLLRAEEQPMMAAWAGIPVALSYTVRPTDSLFVLVFTAYVATHHRKQLTRYLLAAAPIGLLFVAYNYSIYRTILSPYYRSSLSGFLPQNWPRFAEALAGTLISPSRGLFVYTPIFLLAVWSMLRGLWKTSLAPWLATLALLHWIVVSSFVQAWWGGHSYGPRFFTDLIPVFVLFLIPYFAHYSEFSRTLRTAVVALALLGLAMHVRMGWSMAPWNWNTIPTNVNDHPGRNWDWRDPPFLR